FVDKNAGLDKSVSGSGIALTGDEANNYAFDTGAQIGKADIDRKTITAVVNIADKVYDGNGTAVIRDTKLNGVITGDDISASGTAAFSDPAAGQNKTVAVELQLAGGDADNYTLADSPVFGEATIQAPYYVPAGLIAEPSGANGTELSRDRSTNRPVLETSIGPWPVLADTLYNIVPERSEPPQGSGEAATVVRGSALSMGTILSLTLEDTRLEPASTNTLALYDRDPGQPLRGQGLYSATDLGSSITLEREASLVGQSPLLERSSIVSSHGVVPLAGGTWLNLQVALLKGGALLIEVGQTGAGLTSEEIAAYGLAVSKKRLGVNVQALRTVVIERARNLASSEEVSQIGM
ncbi:YDG domain-containing protein, partial [Pseudomonas sp. KSR10]